MGEITLGCYDIQIQNSTVKSDKWSSPNNRNFAEIPELHISIRMGIPSNTWNISFSSKELRAGLSRDFEVNLNRLDSQIVRLVWCKLCTKFSVECLRIHFYLTRSVEHTIANQRGGWLAWSSAGRVSCSGWRILACYEYSWNNWMAGWVPRWWWRLDQQALTVKGWLYCLPCRMAPTDVDLPCKGVRLLRARGKSPRVGDKLLTVDLLAARKGKMSLSEEMM